MGQYERTTKLGKWGGIWRGVELDAQTISNRKFAQAETALGFLHQDVVRREDRSMAEAQSNGKAKRAYAGRGR